MKSPRENALEDCMPKQVADDILGANQTARTKAMGLLNGQGISATALLLSTLSPTALEHPERLLEKTPYS